LGGSPGVAVEVADRPELAAQRRQQPCRVADGALRHQFEERYGADEFVNKKLTRVGA
jgi:hypothetical protein